MRIGIFRKFGLFALITGILPLVITVLVLSMRMRSEFLDVMKANYSQSVISIQDRLDSTLSIYDTITTMPYYYSFGPSENYLSFDTFRRIFYGAEYDRETMEWERRRDVESFLLNLVRSDSYIQSAFFIGYDLDGEVLSFRVDSANRYNISNEDFSALVDWKNHDMNDRNMSIYPINRIGSDDVFTVSRNYFDIRGSLADLNYVGTLYLNIDVRRIRDIVTVSGDDIYLIENGVSWYSSDRDAIGKALPDWDGSMLFYSKDSRYGISVNIIVDPDESYGAIDALYTLAFTLLLASIILFSLGILFISKRFSKQMTSLFEGMDRVEHGDFDVPETKHTRDELGMLYERFRSMGTALKAYIEKAYSAQLRQKEAEVTALKSQIYPHFLYNTLEIIRMNALEEESGERTAAMIEALSEQIHYLIGPVRDFVPLSYEIDIVRKYVFLLNCRVDGLIQFIAPDDGEDIMVPKLILQPLVENAYLHGIKPKGMKGSIEISIRRTGGDVEIAVMDNGIGMSKAGLDKLYALFASDEIGIKDDYAWKSIGVKNVYDRIRLLFGEAYTLSVESAEGIGTIFTIRIPYIKGGEDVPSGGGR